MIAFNTTTIRITDSFSIDYADLSNYLITSSPLFHGLLSTCLQFSSSASAEVRRSPQKALLHFRRYTELLPKEHLNTSIDTSKKIAI